MDGHAKVQKKDKNDKKKQIKGLEEVRAELKSKIEFKKNLK